MRIKKSIVVDNDTAGFLPAMLQCIQTVISHTADVFRFRTVYTKYTAIFMDLSHTYSLFGKKKSRTLQKQGPALERTLQNLKAPLLLQFTDHFFRRLPPAKL